MERPYFQIVLPEGAAALAEGVLRTLDTSIRQGKEPDFAFDGQPGRVLIVVHRLPVEAGDVRMVGVEVPVPLRFAPGISVLDFPPQEQVA